MLKEANKPFGKSDLEETKQTILELKKMMEDFYARGFFTAPVGHFEKGKPGPTLSPEYLWAYSRVVEMINLNPGSKILDAGGAGTPIDFYLAKQGHEVTCIDQQKDLIDWGREIARKMEVKMEFAQRDMTETYFPDNHFDAVISVAALQFLPPGIKIKAIKEFARVLKPGGILGLIIDFGRSTGRKGRYQGEYYDSLHRPFGKIAEIYQYIINPSEMELCGNKELGSNFKIDKNSLRKELLSDIFKNRNLKKILAFAYLFFRSPYFGYTFYSLFLKKPE